MPWIAPVAMIGAAALSAAQGSAASAADREAALGANQQAVQQWLDLNVPDPEQQKVVLQKFIQQGTLTPELEQAINRDSSAYDKIQTDPRLKAAQSEALGSLQDIGHSGGLQLQDQANLQKGLNDVNVADRGRREAIQDNMQRRGMQGSGLGVAAQLGSAQDATNRQSQQQLDTLASARSRALQAIQGGGQLAGQMQQQQYGQQKDLAGARDAISAYNSQNLQNVNNKNVQARNDAASANLAARQAVANANTGIANQQEIQNKGTIQQQYDNQAKKVAGATGQYGNLANAYNNQADRTAGTWAGVGGAIGQGASQYANYNLMDEYLKSKNKTGLSAGSDYQGSGNVV